MVFGKQHFILEEREERNEENTQGNAKTKTKTDTHTQDTLQKTSSYMYRNRGTVKVLLD